MQPDIEKKLADLETKINEIYISVEKTRKYLFWTMVITLAFVLLPLIGLALAIPSFLSTYSEAVNTLGI